MKNFHKIIGKKYGTPCVCMHMMSLKSDSMFQSAMQKWLPLSHLFPAKCNITVRLDENLY